MNLSDVLKQTVTEIGKREDDEMYRSMKFRLVEEKEAVVPRTGLAGFGDTTPGA